MFWLEDSKLPAFAAHLKSLGRYTAGGSYEIYYLLFAHWRIGWPKYWAFPRGPNEDQYKMGCGFENMPTLVAESLYRGEMRYLQAICGWRQIRYHEETHIPCFGLGFDGSEWFFDETGHLIDSAK